MIWFLAFISNAEFEEACLAPKENNNYKLQMWAQDEMLSNGDPIEWIGEFHRGV